MLVCPGIPDLAELRAPGRHAPRSVSSSSTMTSAFSSSTSAPDGYRGRLTLDRHHLVNVTALSCPRR